MCGIIGYLGRKRKCKDILKRLKRLEYRGYDSAGVAVINDGNVICYKEPGAISNLEKSVPDELDTGCAIAHTRWATHGLATKENAHPHSSKNGKWTIVHNGIIENYSEIKKTLKDKPDSTTDTAVVAELLGENNASSIQDFIDAFSQVKGSYSIVAINSDKPNELFLAKNRSPLYVAEKDGCFLVASDPICFVDFSDDYYEFKDNEFAHITDKIEFFDLNGKIQKEKFVLDEMIANFSKNDFDHFMIKEIFEEPEALGRQIKFYRENQVLEKFSKDFMSKFDRVVFVGCGTAYHASIMGAKYFRKTLNIYADAEIASEFIYSKPIFADEKTLFIFVSQSGETADTLIAADMARKSGATTIALTNVLYSSLAKRVNYILPVCAGPEIAVASTKAYVCQLSALYMFCSFLAKKPAEKIFGEIKKIAEKILSFDREKIDKLANDLSNSVNPIFIGKDLDYVTALEAALKLKEITYINATTYPSGELKHGFLALVEKDTPIFVFCCQDELYSKTINASNEAISRGAKRILTTNIKQENDERVIFIDEKDSMLASILAIAPMQYFAYKVSVAKGVNPDKPRNLAKSVTVE